MNMTPLRPDLLVQMCTDDVDVLEAYIGLDRDKPFFGQILGKARLTEQVSISGTSDVTNLIKFYFRVYDPRIHGPHLSNQMLLIHLTCDVSADSITSDSIRRLRAEEQTWGGRAFWLYTPDSDLSGADLQCRRFITRIQSVSRENDLIKLVKAHCSMRRK